MYIPARVHTRTEFQVGEVQLFWEGFDIYLVNGKTTRKIAQIFVAFSEKLNFIGIQA